MTVQIKITKDEVKIYGSSGNLEGSFCHHMAPAAKIYRKKVQRGWSIYGPTWEVHHVNALQICGDLDGMEVRDL